MRKTLGLLLAALALAGCAGEGSDDDPSLTPGDGSGLGNATAPAPLHWEADVLVGADPFNNVPDPGNPTANNPPCSQQVSSCEVHEFTVNGTWNLTATLAWGVPANDLDLYLYQGQTQVSNDGINTIDPVDPSSIVGATSQVMHVALEPGTYQFWVVVWSGAADHYTLDAAFS